MNKKGGRLRNPPPKLILHLLTAASISPDRGDGTRMSYLRFEDHADGIHVFFDDVTDAGPLPMVATFNDTDIATLDRSVPHTIKFVMDFVDGPSNDVVKIYIDTVLKATGTTWEDYYRFDPEQTGGGNQVPTVDSLLFRESGNATPADAGNGYLIDNLALASSIPVVTHTLTYTAGTHGSITGTLSQTVNDGASGTAVTAVADSGFHFVDWTPGDSTANPRTDTNVTSDISVTANFTANPHSEGGHSATPAVPATKIEGCKPGSGDLFDITSGKSCTVKATPAVPAGQVLGAASFNFTKLIKNSSKGDEVIELQKFLNNLGHNCGTADGKFGPKTKACVVKFQLANGLKGDGIVGPLTRFVLNK